MNKIIFKGKLLPTNISIENVPSSRKIDQKLENLCNEKWNGLMMDAKMTGKSLWNSETYRLEMCLQKNGILFLKMATIPFSIRLGMNSFVHLVEELGLDYAAMGMFTSCFIKTADEKYIFIEKSDKYVTNKKYAFVGGVLSKTEKVLSGGEDLFGEVFKEMEEEIGVEQTDVDSNVLTRVYITENFNACILFEVKLNKTYSEIVKKFNSKNDGEVKGLIPVDTADLKTFGESLDKKDQFKIQTLYSIL